MSPILSVRNLSRNFGAIKAVDDVSFDLAKGELLALMRRVVLSGRQLAFMAHFNHPRELESPVALEAGRRLRNAGVQLRTQTPLLNRINADPGTLSQMWRKQTEAGLVPYYLFAARDTGAEIHSALSCSMQCTQPKPRKRITTTGRPR